MVYDDFELSELILISVLNTNPNNITHANMLNTFLHPHTLKSLLKKVLLKKIVPKNPHERILKSMFTLILNIKMFNFGNS